jgi:hypothetical protein
MLVRPLSVLLEAPKLLGDTEPVCGWVGFVGRSRADSGRFRGLVSDIDEEHQDDMTGSKGNLIIRIESVSPQGGLALPHWYVYGFIIYLIIEITLFIFSRAVFESHYSPV